MLVLQNEMSNTSEGNQLSSDNTTVSLDKPTATPASSSKSGGEVSTVSPGDNFKSDLATASKKLLTPILHSSVSKDSDDAAHQVRTPKRVRLAESSGGYAASTVPVTPQQHHGAALVGLEAAYVMTPMKRREKREQHQRNYGNYLPPPHQHPHNYPMPHPSHKPTNSDLSQPKREMGQESAPPALQNSASRSEEERRVHQYYRSGGERPEKVRVLEGGENGVEVVLKASASSDSGSTPRRQGPPHSYPGQQGPYSAVTAGGLPYRDSHGHPVKPRPVRPGGAPPALTGAYGPPPQSGYPPYQGGYSSQQRMYTSSSASFEESEHGRNRRRDDKAGVNVVSPANARRSGEVGRSGSDPSHPGNMFDTWPATPGTPASHMPPDSPYYPPPSHPGGYRPSGYYQYPPSSPVKRTPGGGPPSDFLPAPHTHNMQSPYTYPASPYSPGGWYDNNSPTARGDFKKPVAPTPGTPARREEDERKQQSQQSQPPIQGNKQGSGGSQPSTPHVPPYRYSGGYQQNAHYSAPSVSESFDSDYPHGGSLYKASSGEHPIRGGPPPPSVQKPANYSGPISGPSHPGQQVYDRQSGGSWESASHRGDHYPPASTGGPYEEYYDADGYNRGYGVPPPGYHSDYYGPPPEHVYYRGALPSGQEEVHPLLRDYDPNRDRRRVDEHSPDHSPGSRRSDKSNSHSPSGRKRGPGSEDTLMASGSSPNRPTPSSAAQAAIAAGMTVPAAASEIDFDVHNPPLEPITPPSTQPVCTTPSNVKMHDVLCGRGGGTNTQVGNRRFRQLVMDFQPTYLLCRRKEKPLIARTIVLVIRNRGGRFLKKDEATGMLYEVGDEKAEAKTSQALREGLDVRATKSAASLLSKGKKKKKGFNSDSKRDNMSSGSAEMEDSPTEGRREGPPPEEYRYVEGGYPPYGGQYDQYQYEYDQGSPSRKRSRPPPLGYYNHYQYSQNPYGEPSHQHGPIPTAMSEEESGLWMDFSPPRSKIKKDDENKVRPPMRSPDPEHASPMQFHDQRTPTRRNPPPGQQQQPLVHMEHENQRGYHSAQQAYDRDAHMMSEQWQGV